MIYISNKFQGNYAGRVESNHVTITSHYLLFIFFWRQSLFFDLSTICFLPNHICWCGGMKREKKERTEDLVFVTDFFSSEPIPSSKCPLALCAYPARPYYAHTLLAPGGPPGGGQGQLQQPQASDLLLHFRRTQTHPNTPPPPQQAAASLCQLLLQGQFSKV